MPFIAFKARLEVVVLFFLEEVVVVTPELDVAVVLGRAVFADLVGCGAHALFVVGDEFGVFDLFVFIEPDQEVLLFQFGLEFEDFGLYVQGLWLVRG